MVVRRTGKCPRLDSMAPDNSRRTALALEGTVKLTLTAQAPVVFQNWIDGFPDEIDSRAVAALGAGGQTSHVEDR
jgi:hypothetical protein